MKVNTQKIFFGVRETQQKRARKKNKREEMRRERESRKDVSYLKGDTSACAYSAAPPKDFFFKKRTTRPRKRKWKYRQPRE